MSASGWLRESKLSSRAPSGLCVLLAMASPRPDGDYPLAHPKEDVTQPSLGSTSSLGSLETWGDPRTPRNLSGKDITQGFLSPLHPGPRL